MSNEPWEPPPGVTLVKQPIFIMMLDNDGKLICHIHPPAGWNHKAYGIAICDLVRHASLALRCDEEKIWEWIEKERYNPTDSPRRTQ